MKTRIITAVVAILIFIPVLIFRETIVFPAAMAVLCSVAVYELCRCINGTDTGKIIYFVASALCGGTVLLLSKEVFGTSEYVLYALVFASVAAFVASIFLLKSKNTVKIPLTLCALVYVTVAFIELCASRFTLENGMFFMLFICPWMSDIFAYFIGSKIGKHKLAPVLSPKKSVEGAIAGVIASALAMLVFVIIVTACDEVFEYVVWTFLGAAIGAVSQVGDIYASAYKRKYSVKDYGKLFPGHGGVMDRFDSVFGAAFASPLLMIFESLV